MHTSKSSRVSLTVLVQLACAGAAALLLAAWQADFLLGLYTENQAGRVGYFINGAIALLFLCGIARVAWLLLRYHGEERAVNIFVHNLRTLVEPPVRGVDESAIIAARYATLNEMYERRAVINHSALAATLLAGESGKVSFPRFVNNILILTGVFGTIVSLSIALLGASDMITSTTELGGLGTVIQGMSTALSTTITAILAFLFFGYFYLRLQDVQTSFLARVEHVTATLLLPRFQHAPESVINDYSDMLHSVGDLVNRFSVIQDALLDTQKNVDALLGALHSEIPQGRAALDEIVQLLRSGFRLRDEAEGDGGRR